MSSTKQAVKILVKKLQFNPVPLGGKQIYTSVLGIVLGAIVMIIVAVYAVGKVSVINDDANVVTSTYQDQNDPYEVDLSSWNLRMSVYENLSRQYVMPDNMFEMGLNITVWSLQGEDLQKKNPSSLIEYYNQSEKLMTINKQKTPFNVSGSRYVHGSPFIKQYLFQIRFCQTAIDSRCDQNSNRFYTFTLYLDPNWVSLNNPRQSGIRQMSFYQKIKIDRRLSFPKYQYTYDVTAFNVSSDTSLLPAFIPRTLRYQNGSSIAGPAIKVYLPQQSKNIIQFHFRRSETSYYYTRKFNSVDVVFAEILGVIAVLGLILYLLFAHSTTWGSQQFILNQVLGTNKKINFFQYLKFYLTCKKRSKKQEKILKQVHQNIIDSYKERKRRKIQIQILKLRVNKLQQHLKVQNSENVCKQQILQRLQQEEKEELFNSSMLTEEVRATLLRK